MLVTKLCGARDFRVICSRGGCSFTPWNEEIFTEVCYFQVFSLPNAWIRSALKYKCKYNTNTESHYITWSLLAISASPQPPSFARRVGLAPAPRVHPRTALGFSKSRECSCPLDPSWWCHSSGILGARGPAYRLLVWSQGPHEEPRPHCG